MSKRYDALGVSASKEEIHEAIKNHDKGIYPDAFCKILPDLVANNSDYCNLIHADTAGTKTSLAYLYWKETGDISIWDGVAQDALVMNIDDLACVGLIDGIVISSTIGRNKHLIPGIVIDRIISATENILKDLRNLGIGIHSGGGETADVGDIVRTIDVGITAFGRMKRSDVIRINIQSGAVIVGLSSSGQASYEHKYNSGIGSNGLTAARHDVLSKYYLQKYPESVSMETNHEVQYTGPHRLTDLYSYQHQQYEIGQLLLSPTRTYLPVISQIIANHRNNIQGIIHCTGGAQTKVKKFIHRRRIIKDNLFELPPVFDLIKEVTLCTPDEMYEVYNMGHRLEIYTDPDFADHIISISKEFGIDAKVIGRVEESDKAEVIVVNEHSRFTYS